MSYIYLVKPLSKPPYSSCKDSTDYYLLGEANFAELPTLLGKLEQQKGQGYIFIPQLQGNLEDIVVSSCAAIHPSVFNIFLWT